MNGHTRVHISRTGCATIRTDGSDPAAYCPGGYPGELHYTQFQVAFAQRKAEECCDSRRVYYPVGTAHCPCLACCVDRAFRRWREGNDQTEGE